MDLNQQLHVPNQNVEIRPSVTYGIQALKANSASYANLQRTYLRG